MYVYLYVFLDVLEIYNNKSKYNFIIAYGRKYNK